MIFIACKIQRQENHDSHVFTNFASIAICCTTRMHSSRMRTVRNSSRLLFGEVSTPPGRRPPGSRPPEHTLPGSTRHPPRAGSPQEQTPLGAGIPQSRQPPAARHTGIPPAMHAGIAHPPPCEQNHRHV